MSTNSTIAILNSDGSIDSIYAHWDGHIESNGFYLEGYYKTPTKVKNLIKPGAISSLKKYCENPPPEHTFDVPAKDHTTYYMRDRGENSDFVKVQKFETVQDWFDCSEQEYNYLYVESKKKWFVARKKNNTIMLISLYREIKKMNDYYPNLISDLKNIDKEIKEKKLLEKTIKKSLKNKLVKV